MSNDDTMATADLSGFGYRELSMAADLLREIADHGYPNGYSDGLTLNLNKNSGYVFLSDEDYRVWMLNGGTLEEFFSCPECGAEGFAEDLIYDGEHRKDGDAIAHGEIDEDAEASE